MIFCSLADNFHHSTPESLLKITFAVIPTNAVRILQAEQQLMLRYASPTASVSCMFGENDIHTGM